MKAKKRYALLLLIICLSVACLFWLWSSYASLQAILTMAPAPVPGSAYDNRDTLSESYFTFDDLAKDNDILGSRLRDNRYGASVSRHRDCSMSTCFDISRCIRQSTLKVHIYPSELLENRVDATDTNSEYRTSESYARILSLIRHSPFYTADPDEACLFVLAYDTLDRDSLSGDFVKSFARKILELPPKLWNDGANHLVFNLYSGTWPNYVETDWGFSPGKAILAKASFSLRHFRTNFDISLPLFHPELPLKGGDINATARLSFPAGDRYLVSFKGKRYVHGIGSATRNALYHLSNDKDVVMVTTCKHGRLWKELQDERCPLDNTAFERWDYDVLLQNSTFCIVPRGRRLGSFRFLETLAAGCIPVILSNEWVLPFSEVIDWSSAIVLADERLLFQVTDVLRSMPSEQIFRMKQLCQKLYLLYFSSLEHIVMTTLEIIAGRIERWRSRTKFAWNQSPLAVLRDAEIFDASRSIFELNNSLSHVPLRQRLSDHYVYFTAVITASSHGALVKALASLAKAKYFSKIIVCWRSEDEPIPKLKTKMFNYRKFVSVQIFEKARTVDLVHFERQLFTPAVFSIDADSFALSSDEIDFAVEVWLSFPDRLVGFFSSCAEPSDQRWQYSANPLNHYSMLSTAALVFHRYYLHAYVRSLSPAIRQILAQYPCCEDILLNVIASRISGKAPLKLLAHASDFSSSASLSSHSSFWSSAHRCSRSNFSSVADASFDATEQRTLCVNAFVDIFGGNPLKQNIVRFSPLLFKDPISNFRKKYRQLE